jgi:FkbM family methyltransferase
VVPITRLDSLLERYNPTHVGVLMIDVEGAKLLVLDSFPWGEDESPIHHV